MHSKLDPRRNIEPPPPQVSMIAGIHWQYLGDLCTYYCIAYICCFCHRVKLDVRLDFTQYTETKSTWYPGKAEHSDFWSHPPFQFPADVQDPARPVSLGLHRLDFHCQFFNITSFKPDHSLWNELICMKPIKIAVSPGCVQILESHGKCWNLKFKFSRPGKSWN